MITISSPHSSPTATAPPPRCNTITRRCATPVAPVALPVLICVLLPQDLKEPAEQQPPLVSNNDTNDFEQSSHDPPNLVDATSEPAKNEPVNNSKQFSPAARFAQDTAPGSLSSQHSYAASSSGSAIFIFPTSTEFQHYRPFHSSMKVTTSTPKCVLTVRGTQSQLHFFSVHLISLMLFLLPLCPLPLFLVHLFSFSLPFFLAAYQCGQNVQITIRQRCPIIRCANI